MKQSYLYIREQIHKIQDALNDKELSSDKKLDYIQSALRVLDVENYSGIDQETKQRIINLKNKLANRESYNNEDLLLEAAQLVDHVLKVSE